MSARGSEWIDNISREESPEGHDGFPEKRPSKKRKVLSCYACRSRKMKCDRVYPVCGRCEKAGNSSLCTYDPRLLEESNFGATERGHGPIVLGECSPKHPTPANTASTALQWKIECQERRLETLERKLAAHKPRDNTSPYAGFAQEEPDIKEEMMFRGKGFKTAFHGATSIMSSIARYRELQSFTREALTVDHSIMRVKTDFKTFRDRRKRVANEQRVKVYGTDSEVFAALPEKTVIDVQALVYFQTWETSYKIFHEPSFWHEYHQFWEHRDAGERSPSFAVIMILIVATTKCVSLKNDVFIGDTTADRQAAADLIDICEAWIVHQPRKRQTLSFFQIHCLSLLAKRANTVRLKQDWINSGDLVRLALSSGMHRDPGLLATGKISVFEKEMKKRLWATIVELELQSSIEAGLQSSLTSLYFDTPAPVNVDDEAFSVSATQTPVPRPLEQFTSTSYLVHSLRSLPLRIQLAQVLNTPTTASNLQYSDILHYDAQIHKAINLLPTWEEQFAGPPAALLRLQLLHYLLLLHGPYARLVPRDQRYTYSLTTVIDTASSIVVAHHKLSSGGHLALSHFRNDVLRVGITVSQIVFANCTQSEVKPGTLAIRDAETHFADPETHLADVPTHKRLDQPSVPLYLAALPETTSLSRIMCVTSLELLERTRQLFEQKVLRLGTGYMEFWLLTAAIGMLPSAPSPSTSIAYVTNSDDNVLARCKKTLDQFTTLASRVLALQKDPQAKFASSLRDTMASISPSDGRTPSVSVGIVTEPGAAIQPGNLPSFDTFSGLGLSTATGDASKDPAGTFDALQDLQFDLGGWSFPDFWAFDLGGEY
ncbi:hypothetical protein T440DRAFT_483669 [Plenodomus tracheiphilus IPT5]|uniref:Zn(2)-C6 fungal-type domain-containing protein n=1 Tax=Plenodomus tracheiphilus IPT5 TaxID=1408161 RepID=A0A6A7APM3_9PLEO|nr:hypothetical protein T440DRAFT_483669 [Plenodomus tracheiphilus IPT5]